MDKDCSSGKIEEPIRNLISSILNDGRGRIIVSACLAGINCRYDGGTCENERIRNLVERGKAILICPESDGGLPIPRPPAEIMGGDGDDVIAGRSRIQNNQGADVTYFFLKGAEAAAKTAKDNQALLAVLKARSPSCGVGEIYDGTFSGGLKQGDGITTSLLKQEGIQVISDETWNVLNE